MTAIFSAFAKAYLQVFCWGWVGIHITSWSSNYRSSTSTFSSTPFKQFICLFILLVLITIAQPCIRIVRHLIIFLIGREWEQEQGQKWQTPWGPHQPEAQD